MRILIIGSEGFIGGHTVSYLKAKGYKVFTADIVLKTIENYTVINPEFPDFGRLFYNKTFDVCINATGAANVQFSFQHASLDFSLNTSNVYHILEAIRQFNPTCKFINFSSAAVYGNPIYLPVDEKHPIKPMSPYGWHKNYSEQICKEFFTYFGIKTLSLRVFSAYGPGLKKQIFWDLFQKSLQSEPIQIYGTGNESRDFIYIDDLAQAIDCIINNSEFDGSNINIANGEEVFINNTVDIFYKLFNKNLNYSFTGETKIGDPINWVADISTLKLSGYKQKINLQEGLMLYYQWLTEKQ